MTWYTGTMSFSVDENKILQQLDTPEKIQNYLNTIPFNFEKDGKCTIKSPLRTMRENSAHCFEGALLGAYVLSLQGHRPLIMALIASTTRLRDGGRDFDHCIAPFQINGLWGALSKTNHAVLRYREPVYKTIRELVMSYFHEYFMNDGTKTLRAYTKPINIHSISKQAKINWHESTEDLWHIDEAIDRSDHCAVAPDEALKHLRKADAIERDAGLLTEWK